MRGAVRSAALSGLARAPGARFASFISQRHQGIDHGHPAGGKVASQQSDQGEQRRDNDEGEGISRLNSEQPVGEKASQSQSTGNALGSHGQRYRCGVAQAA